MGDVSDLNTDVMHRLMDRLPSSLGPLYSAELGFQMCVCMSVPEEVCLQQSVMDRSYC